MACTRERDTAWREAGSEGRGWNELEQQKKRGRGGGTRCTGICIMCSNIKRPRLSAGWRWPSGIVARYICTRIGMRCTALRSFLRLSFSPSSSFSSRLCSLSSTVPLFPFYFCYIDLRAASSCHVSPLSPVLQDESSSHRPKAKNDTHGVTRNKREKRRPVNCEIRYTRNELYFVYIYLFIYLSRREKVREKDNDEVK